MEISIRKPNTNVKTKVDKEALKRERMYQKAIKQATYRPTSISVPVPVNYVTGYKFYLRCLYALAFVLWFVDSFFNL